MVEIDNELWGLSDTLDVPPPDEPDGGEPRSSGRAALASELDRQRAIRQARRILDAEERPPATIPDVLTLRQRLAQPRPPLTFRIAGWQPTGTRVVIAAQYKAGKTTLTGNLARSLVDGDPFLAQHHADPVNGKLAVVDFEMHAAQLDTWLEDQGIRDDDRVVVLPMRGSAAAFDILDPDERARWAALLADNHVAYVILDCLRPVLDALGLDEHRDAGRFLVAFDALLTEAGIAEAALVHHMGHTGERSRGDSRIRDWPDVEWRLVRETLDDPASPRYLSAFGRDIEQPEQRLAFDPLNRHLSIDGGSRRDAAAERAMADVARVVAEEPGLSGRALEQHDALDEHKRVAIRSALKLGQQNGEFHVVDGDRRAKLYHPRQCASAPSAPAVRRRSSGECASAPIGGAHTAHTETDPSAPCLGCGKPRPINPNTRLCGSCSDAEERTNR